MSTYTSHLPDKARPSRTVCGEPWPAWQARGRGRRPVSRVVPQAGRDTIVQCVACLAVTEPVAPGPRRMQPAASWADEEIGLGVVRYPRA